MNVYYVIGVLLKYNNKIFWVDYMEKKNIHIMKKMYILIMIFLFIISCSYEDSEFDSNPLDPAKGLDSKGGKAIIEGYVYDAITRITIQGATILATSSNEAGYEIDSTSVNTDENGFYMIRLDISDNDDFECDIIILNCILESPNYIPIEKTIKIGSSVLYNIDLPCYTIDSLPSLTLSYQTFHISSYEIKWFKFNPTENKNYRIEWIDYEYNFNNNYADIVVSAYKNNLNSSQLVNVDGNYFSSSISLTTSDTLIIKVEPHMVNYYSSGYFEMRIYMIP